MSEPFSRWSAQLHTLRGQVEKALREAESSLETLETRQGVTPKELEAQTELVERLESVLECLDEAVQHCED